MPLSHPILLPPPPIDEELLAEETPCVSDFARNLEACIRTQQQNLLDIVAAVHGYDVCVYNPTFIDSDYDEEDQGFHYPLQPDFTGRVVIKGLVEYLRYGGEDQWTPAEVLLYLNEPASIIIKENARIVVNTIEQRVTFRAKFYKKQYGQFVSYRRIYTLIPYM